MSIEGQKAQNENIFLRGRRIAYMIYYHLRVTGAGDSVLDFSDLMGVAFRGERPRFRYEM